MWNRETRSIFIYLFDQYRLSKVFYQSKKIMALSVNFCPVLDVCISHVNETRAETKINTRSFYAFNKLIFKNYLKENITGVLIEVTHL